MRTILIIIRKEFIQIFRNKVMVPIIFLMPILQLVILVNAATFELKNIKTVIVDQDISSMSRGVIADIKGSPFFLIKNHTPNLKEAEGFLLENSADLIINIPQNFEKNLYSDKKGEVQLLINAVNSSKASLIYQYTASIIGNYNRGVMVNILGDVKSMPVYNINIETRYWFNPMLNYQIYMTPAVLVILITVIGMFLTAINIIREKETGTLEQLNVTPIKKYQFISGKVIPFWIIGQIELTVGLILGILIFNMPFEGNMLHLYVFSSVYLMVALGIGLFFSTLAESQQQVMFIAFFFMLTFIIMGGIFTPTESMPAWAQQVNIINPFAYFIRVIRMVVLKGSGLKDIINETYSLLIYASIILSLAIWRYRKVS